MLLIIHNLPTQTHYEDVRELIVSKSGLHDFILDDLREEGCGMKVTIIIEEEDASVVVQNIEGLCYRGQILIVEERKPDKNVQYENEDMKFGQLQIIHQHPESKAVQGYTEPEVPFTHHLHWHRDPRNQHADLELQKSQDKYDSENKQNYTATQTIASSANQASSHSANLCNKSSNQSNSKSVTLVDSHESAKKIDKDKPPQKQLQHLQTPFQIRARKIKRECNELAFQKLWSDFSTNVNALEPEKPSPLKAALRKLLYLRISHITDTEVMAPEDIFVFYRKLYTYWKDFAVFSKIKEKIAEKRDIPYSELNDYLSSFVDTSQRPLRAADMQEEPLAGPLPNPSSYNRENFLRRCNSHGINKLSHTTMKNVEIQWLANEQSFFKAAVREAIRYRVEHVANREILAENDISKRYRKKYPNSGDQDMCRRIQFQIAENIRMNRSFPDYEFNDFLAKFVDDTKTPPYQPKLPEHISKNPPLPNPKSLPPVSIPATSTQIPPLLSFPLFVPLSSPSNRPPRPTGTNLCQVYPQNMVPNQTWNAPPTSKMGKKRAKRLKKYKENKKRISNDITNSMIDLLKVPEPQTKTSDITKSIIDLLKCSEPQKESNTKATMHLSGPMRATDLSDNMESNDVILIEREVPTIELSDEEFIDNVYFPKEYL